MADKVGHLDIRSWSVDLYPRSYGFFDGYDDIDWLSIYIEHEACPEYFAERHPNWNKKLFHDRSNGVGINENFDSEIQEIQECMNQ
jgi:hypothetical protein